MGWIIAAIIAIVFVQVMDLRDMVDTVKRIRKLEEEHDHLADKCGKAIMQVENIIKAADEVIKASDDLNDTYREFIEVTKRQEEEADDEETGQ